MEERDFLLRLSLTKGIGIVSKTKIYNFAKTNHFWNLTANEIGLITKCRQPNNWHDLTMDHLAEIKRTHQYITYCDEIYPEELRQIPQPPLVIFYKGNIDLISRSKIAVVGARNASNYGFDVCKKLVGDLVKHQFVIVSGLAKGIDSYAHQFAISYFGKTIAVIGTGLDICYPKESANLQIEMAKNHLILSEYPNGTSPQKFHFPMRNRIIAALASGVLVVEAKVRSGSLITAQVALEYGKEVFAVPGSIIDGRSSGCHQLIQDGAVCVENVQNIIDSYQLLKKIY
ncbi:DNA-processing protein DprA [Enterococcus alishanensis]|uniref:DNA-processing protein DprA n=1 Tax=Enterococcus alishanensis TaxID=1303817 RepID=A0ABS6TAX7_9ENTE|nr:DNA-processing protein DprA [Enterococcus alishanensis]MBV7390052.1 DNA-processing protein DprA [Enterococcus alishanensis]